MIENTMRCIISRASVIALVSRLNFGLVIARSGRSRTVCHSGKRSAGIHATLVILRNYVSLIRLKS